MNEYINTAINERLQGVRKRIEAALAARAYEAGVRGLSVPDLLGCSLDYFMEYIEAKFRPGMGWHNYGKARGQWCIDHINVLSAFDMTNEREARLAFGYLNCRPLWNRENWARPRLCADHVRTRSLTTGGVSPLLTTTRLITSAGVQLAWNF